MTSDLPTVRVPTQCYSKNRDGTGEWCQIVRPDDLAAFVRAVVDERLRAVVDETNKIHDLSGGMSIHAGCIVIAIKRVSNWPSAPAAPAARENDSHPPAARARAADPLASALDRALTCWRDPEMRASAHFDAAMDDLARLSRPADQGEGA
jgi:hypothetical protein